MQILINPTEVNLYSKGSVFNDYLLEAKDKSGLVLATLSLEMTRDSTCLSMLSFGRIYKAELPKAEVSNFEEILEKMLNQVNLTIRKNEN